MRKQIIFMGLSGLIVGIGVSLKVKKLNNSINEIKELAEKNRVQFILVNQWLKLKQSGGSICRYLSENGYEKIAIYGMGYIGERVLCELENSDVKIAYGIDKRADGITSSVDIFSLNENLPEVDAVIVSEPFYFDAVEPLLKEKLDCPVLSLEEIVYES